MDTSRLLRTSGTLAATAALLLSALTAGNAAPTASAAARPHGGDEPGTTLVADRPDLAAPLRPYYAQKLNWRSCAGKGAGFECASMKVPLDYAVPRGGDISLAVSRKRATDPSARLGSLLVNPGGPGGSAIDYLQSHAATKYPAEVRARYDLVAVDPRGVGRSTPVNCLSDSDMDRYTQADPNPQTAAETRGYVANLKKFSQGCATRAGRVLRHVSTAEAARDMDVLRGLLGDSKLHYVGASYGTFLGATYAELFPSRVGRLVLDGALDPSLSAERVNREQAAGFQTAFTSFARDCARRVDCPLGTSGPDDAGKRLRAFLAGLDRHPLATGESRRLTEGLATTGVIAAMYDEGAWPALRKALADAAGGDGKVLLALSDAYYERDERGAYSNLMAANSAVNCLDAPAAFRGPDGVRRALPAFRKASPVLGEALAWASLGCAYWPVRSTGHPHRITARGAAPILVVGTTRDPATPYPWARALASQLSSGRLLTYDGDGHTAYTRGSECVDEAVDSYLLTGTPPPATRRCS
ncbi:alpha/beta fold hydrolase [Streptomyces sp. AV19]|uniref:alpha/beta hydrolase n=1 Tax=Streptomyces sp. AV19 TaxID=2793068 RepID=UPI0018FE99F8|nr:alpha/beta hydrolase [Streptomyces sp. AV19]MBH1934894.1 alpha/beta fold hydrolase [Streptomyces sp. AV19]MDG4537028.1 alpha/beta hydrolase [Streptomyces sp. AV19]